MFKPVCLALLVLLLSDAGICHAADNPHPVADFPPALDHYQDRSLTPVAEILSHRVDQVPFNLVALLIFLLTVVHTFLTSRFTAIAHRLDTTGVPSCITSGTKSTMWNRCSWS